MKLPKLTITEAMIIEGALKQIEQRLRRIEVASPICRHSKRKHQLNKKYRYFVRLHAELVKKLQTMPGY